MQTDIANVIHDYPNGFRNITGEEIMNNPQPTEFDCKTSIKDATKCRIIKYTSSIKETYSWEAEMMRTEDFDEASKKFRSIYNSLRHLSVDTDGAKPFFKETISNPLNL